MDVKVMKKKVIKPQKKNDMELWSLISDAILKADYIFVMHAKTRQQQRGILDIDILDILENKEGRKRKRNKSKDTYTMVIKTGTTALKVAILMRLMVISGLSFLLTSNQC